jgi:hypothetical protein
MSLTSDINNAKIGIIISSIILLLSIGGLIPVVIFFKKTGNKIDEYEKTNTSNDLTNDEEFKKLKGESTKYKALVGVMSIIAFISLCFLIHYIIEISSKYYYLSN